MPLAAHLDAEYCGARGQSRKAAPEPMSTRHVSCCAGEGSVPFCLTKWWKASLAVYRVPVMFTSVMLRSGLVGSWSLPGGRQ